MQRQQRWWLGFLGLIGFYKVPDMIMAWHSCDSMWEFLSLGWFIWLLFFIPEVRRDA